ncbi:hypothetical protein PO909_022275 [Leuciscus waleckii]
MSQAEISTCSAPQRVFQEAVKKGNTKELHSLLQNMTNCEFNVNSFGPEGQTALHQSVIDGNLELVKLLVKFGADIRLANREGWSALHIAAFGGHQDIVLYLITKAKYSSGARYLDLKVFDNIICSLSQTFSLTLLSYPLVLNRISMPCLGNCT